MAVRRIIVGVVAAAMAGLVCSVAWGLINPNFTPIHLTDQSALILRARLASKAVGEKAKFTVLEVLKGKAPGKVVTVDLSIAPKQHAEAARKHLVATADEPVLLFAGKYEDKERGYLHVRGIWLSLSRAKGGGWALDAIDDQMAGTWNGGTDMLERCVRYILKYGGDATVPVAPGTAWRSIVKAGQVKGKVTSIAAVDLAGDGKLVLHLACPAGDMLLRNPAGKEQFKDITAKVRLGAKSVAAAWGDFNGDGRVDLASFDGAALTIWTQAADGTFSAAKAGGKFVIPAKGVSLTAVACGKGPAAGLVVGGVSPPLLLVPAGGNAFVAAALKADKALTARWGKPQQCIVADFNNDALPDVLQPYEKGGMLYLGKGGGFAEGRPCGVAVGPGGGRADVGDFDADGYLDILTAGADGVRLWHNLRGGKFVESLGLSGEMSYKTQPMASWCGVCDFNNDSRPDTYITYSAQPLLLYFNRGFRSFGQAPKLELALAEIEGLEQGQQMGVFADFDHDGAQDLALVLVDGRIWCAYNDLGGDGLGVRVRLGRKLPLAGPVNVTMWSEGRCLGAFPVRRDRPAFIGIEEAGEFVLKYRLPGGKEVTRKLTVEEGTADVVIGKPK